MDSDSSPGQLEIPLEIRVANQVNHLCTHACMYMYMYTRLHKSTHSGVYTKPLYTMYMIYTHTHTHTNTHTHTQTRPVPFTLRAQVTVSDIEFGPSSIDFGSCTVHESVVASLQLTNKSLLPQEFGFVHLPEVGPEESLMARAQKQCF